MITISLAHLKILPNAHARSYCLLRFALCLLVSFQSSLTVMLALALEFAPVYFCPFPFALCLLTCFSSYLAAPSQTAVTLKAPSQDDRVLRAVVQLVAVGPAEKGQNRECSATGFLINEEGYLITNAHVIEDAKRCFERTTGAKILAKLATTGPRTAMAVACEVVGVDQTHDVALLKTARPVVVDPGAAPPYALLDAREVTKGTAVVVSGHPEFSWQPVTQAGRVVRRGQAHLAGEDAAPSDTLELDIPLRPGNSGSPVYRQGGGVVAIVDQKDSLRPSHSVAVSIRYAIALAEHYGVQWHGVD
jgi:S1-C subfamily serine protease